MDDQAPDFSINSYGIDDLLNIFGVTTPTTKERIMEIASEFIDKYRQVNRLDYVEFFSQAMNKLVSGYATVEEILDRSKEAVEKTDNLLDAAEAGVDMLQTDEPSEPAVNMLENQYYMNGGIAGRAAEQLPNRRDNVSVIDENHATQAQRRLLIPNAYAQLPFSQGNMNPALRNFYLTWVNVDSHYREIQQNSHSTPCPSPDQSQPPFITQMDTSTDFSFVLSDPLTNVMALTVGSVEIPLASYYPFSKRYGTTSFEIRYDTSHNCITIPEGNYTAETIQEVINAELDAKGYPVKIFINPSTQKASLALKHEESGDLAVTWYGADCGLDCDVSSCDIENTGKKLDSSLGWMLGFRQPFYTDISNCEPTIDASLNEWAKGGASQTGGCWRGAQSECVFNQLGTRYMILEIDDYNRNRNSGNMSTLTNNRDKFKMPDYARRTQASFPICVEQCTSLSLPVISEQRPGKFGPELIARACRRGTPNPNPIIDGSNNLTQAQKYTAEQMMNAQHTQVQQRYFAPTASNVLFRFPIARLSPSIQAPVVIPNEAGLDNARTYFGPTTIKRLRVRLLDDKGYPVPLCSDFSFSLIVQRLYQY